MTAVEKLHRQLGHPGRDRLIAAIRQAGWEEEFVVAAREHQCSTCQNVQSKKLTHPSALPGSSSFNDVLKMDTFHIKWDDKKCRVLALIETVSRRYEMNQMIEAETEKEELQLVDAWVEAFGISARIRTDASGAHMSEQFLSYMDDKNIKLLLVPKEAHHRIGLVERLHAVRRLQLLKMKHENPKLSLSAAVPLACAARSQIRSIHGSSPSQIVFGRNPRQNGLMDEPLTNVSAGSTQHQELQLKLSAVMSFYVANQNQTLRKALLSKSRKDDPEFFPGDWVYYWRQGDGKLEISRWRGPALVCSMTPRDAPNEAPLPSTYWLAHGSALVQVAREHLRAEAPRERQARLEHMPQTAHVADIQSAVRRALQPVRGPVRFLDLSGTPPIGNGV